MVAGRSLRPALNAVAAPASAQSLLLVVVVGGRDGPSLSVGHSRVHGRCATDTPRRRHRGVARRPPRRSTLGLLLTGTRLAPGWCVDPS